MNAVILTSILSAGNSGLYASTRMLYAMSKDGLANKKFGRVNKQGVPMLALLITAGVTLLLFFVQNTSENAVNLILAASGLTGFIAWLGIAISHYRFRKAYMAQGKNLSDLIYKAKWFPFGPLFALALCILVIIGQDSDLVFKGVVDWKAIAITYMGIPFFLSFYIYHKIKYKTKLIPLKEVNLDKY